MLRRRLQLLCNELPAVRCAGNFVEHLGDVVACPPADNVFLYVEAAKQVVNVIEVDLNEASVHSVVQHLGNEVHYVEADRRDALRRRVRELGAYGLGANRSGIGGLKRLPEVAKQFVEITVTLGLMRLSDAMSADGSLSGGFGVPFVGDGLLVRALTSRSAWS